MPNSAVRPRGQLRHPRSTAVLPLGRDTPYTRSAAILSGCLRMLPARPRRPPDVRFGSFADVTTRRRNGRITLQSRHTRCELGRDVGRQEADRSSCAQLPVSPAYGAIRANKPKPMTCSRRSMAGLPKGSRRPNTRTQRRARGIAQEDHLMTGAESRVGAKLLAPSHRPRQSPIKLHKAEFPIICSFSLSTAHKRYPGRRFVRRRLDNAAGFTNSTI